MMHRSAPSDSSRLRSLDAFRGLAVAGMVLVNTPGSWAHMHPPLRHAAWNGYTPADLVFPFFLFAAGVALTASLSRQATFFSGAWRLLLRAGMLFALGLLLNAVPALLDGALRHAPPDLSGVRVMGVLQRIGCATLIAGAAVLLLPARGRLAIAALVLLGYWAALMFVPVPGHGAGSLTPEGNYAAYVDRLVLTPKRMYRGGPCDPEGLLSTLPAAAGMLLGCGAGRLLQSRPPWSAAAQLLGLGIVCLTAGMLWDTVLPINKALWTSSYVMLSTGWALIVFGVLYVLMDVLGWTLPGRPLEVMGRNALLLFAGSSMLVCALLALPASGASTYGWLYAQVSALGLTPANASLAFSCAFLALWWVLLCWLYRRRIFITLH